MDPPSCIEARGDGIPMAALHNRLVWHEEAPIHAVEDLHLHLKGAFKDIQ